MKKIMMTKYGFQRWPEEDFNDDGNRFTCYKVGERVRVSKHTSNGRVYIAARIDGIKLPYEAYSKLPHYRALEKLNGVSLDLLTESELFALYNACLEYEKEYNDAEKTIKMPTIQDIADQCVRIQTKIERDIEEIENLLKDNFPKIMGNIGEYDWKKLRDYYIKLKKTYNQYNPKVYPATILDCWLSIDFCKSDACALSDSFYYTSILELLDKILAN